MVSDNDDDSDSEYFLVGVMQTVAKDVIIIKTASAPCTTDFYCLYLLF